PQAVDLQGSASPGPQVADAQLPHSRAAGAVPRRALRPHRPRSVCRLPLDGQSVEVALRDAWPPEADVRRPGGARPPALYDALCGTGKGQGIDPAGALPRVALRGPGARPDRADEGDVRRARSGRLRGGAPEV